ncbi:MAG: type IV pilus assembly protein PilM [Candidatus Moranbacteria bacterium]|nr:type IV pilus assembly protein PilM [Candidatus Moranbacteria bacterium]
MFEFLNGNKNHFIGIDFGISSIKVVELSYKDQQAHLENYGVVDLDWISSTGQVTSSNASYEQKLNDALKSLVEKMNLKHGSQTFVSIPGFSGLITIIELPEMAQDELANAIQFEAHKYIPSSLDEVAMSWEIIEYVDAQAGSQGQTKDGGKKIKVLLVAAPKKDIEHYGRLVAGTNLQVSAIELETFSIERSLVGEDSGTFLIIDIGSHATNIILVEKGVVRVNRNIDAGGNEITIAISDSMKISRQRAEAFKCGEKDFLNTTESSFIVPVLELIVGESRRILSAYLEKNNNSKIDAMFLSGGTAKMKGIEQYFSRALGQPVTIGNPWRRITFDDNAKHLVENLGASFSVAIGLALRGLDEHKRK